MKARMVCGWVAATLAGVLLSGPGWASRIPGATVSGHVTAVHGTDAVTVDGRQYRIRPGSGAESAVAKLSPGQLVDLILDGPLTSSATAVVAVMPHKGK